MLHDLDAVRPVESRTVTVRLYCGGCRRCAGETFRPRLENQSRNGSSDDLYQVDAGASQGESLTNGYAHTTGKGRSSEVC